MAYAGVECAGVECTGVEYSGAECTDAACAGVAFADAACAGVTYAGVVFVTSVAQPTEEAPMASVALTDDAVFTATDFPFLKESIDIPFRISPMQYPHHEH